jgi:peptide/nickel transport system substrate-binding protein
MLYLQSYLKKLGMKSIKLKTQKQLSILGLAIALTACGGGEGKKDDGNNANNVNPNIVLHELSDADMLNPYNYQDAGAGYILPNVFQTLLSIDFKTLELVPVLAESRPELEPNDKGGLNITYKIRKEATWDDGTPITAKDVEFSLKVMKNPKVDNARLKPYYEFILDMKFYDDDPKKFTFICDKVYILAEASSGDFSILPKSTYDPKGLMDEFTIVQLNTEADKLKDNPKITEFADWFNSENFQREKEYIKGSGAYTLKEWVTGQRITLVRKEKWWGDNVTENKNDYLTANLPQITYQTINDQTAALVALKGEQIDVMRSVKPKDFSELLENEKFLSKYNATTPPFMAYNYLGINTRLPKFSDKRTRQAFAHLVDVDKLIKILQYGYGQRVTGPIHPSKKKQYNPNIKPYDYNPERAKELLAEVGWKDSDGDGTLDMVLNGKKTDLTIKFTVNAGNDIRKQTALFFQEDCRKVGIKVDVVPEDWSIYIENQKNHKFEMFYGGWVAAPTPNDHKQIFHTESYNGGSNYTGFGNTETDALIDSIRVSLDEDKRAKFNYKLQEIMHDNCHYIFLYAPTERIAIHNRFGNAETSPMRPGYWEAAFTTGSATTK